MFETLVQVEDEADEGNCEGEIGVAGRRLHPRNEPEKIGRENKHEKRAEEGDVLARAVALEHAADETVEPLGQNLANRAQGDSFLGDGRVIGRHQGSPRQKPENNQDSHRDPSANQDRGEMHSFRDEIDEIYRIQTIASAPWPDRYAARAETRQVSTKIAPG